MECRLSRVRCKRVGATYQTASSQVVSTSCPYMACFMKRQYRLRHNADFQRVRRDGKFYASPFMVLAFLRNGLAYSRFGFVVNKRMGGAVQRNRIKRRMREAVRVRAPHLKPGFDLVFIARQPIGPASYAEIERFLEQLLNEAGLLALPGEQLTVV